MPSLITLNITSKKIPFNKRTPDERVVKLQYKTGNTIAAVKRKLEVQTQIPDNAQILIFGTSNREEDNILLDTCSLLDYSSKNNDTIVMKVEDHATLLPVEDSPFLFVTNYFKNVFKFIDALVDNHNNPNNNNGTNNGNNNNNSNSSQNSNGVQSKHSPSKSQSNSNPNGANSFGYQSFDSIKIKKNKGDTSSPQREIGFVRKNASLLISSAVIIGYLMKYKGSYTEKLNDILCHLSFICCIF